MSEIQLLCIETVDPGPLSFYKNLDIIKRHKKDLETLKPVCQDTSLTD